MQGRLEKSNLRIIHRFYQNPGVLNSAGTGSCGQSGARSGEDYTKNRLRRRAVPNTGTYAMGRLPAVC